MQVKADECQNESVFGKTGEGVLKQPAVIGFKMNRSLASEHLLILFQERMIGQTALFMALFRPRVGKIQIDPGRLPRLQKRLKAYWH